MLLGLSFPAWASGPALDFDRGLDIRGILSGARSSAEAGQGRSVFSRPVGPAQEARYPWPVEKFAIGLNFGAYQRYNEGESYFHPGLDILAPAGTVVRACLGGTVVGLGTGAKNEPEYWYVSIRDRRGYIWEYVHLKKESITVKVGDVVAARAILGRIYPWPWRSLWGTYDHVHLQIRDKAGVYLNPLRLLAPMSDPDRPFISGIFLAQGGKRVFENAVSGPYTIILDASDLMGSRFPVAPYRVSWRIDGRLRPHKVWQFDTLPGKASESKRVHGLYWNSAGGYANRRSAMDLGFSPMGPLRFPQEPGEHRIVVTVEDFAGNAASQELSWTVVPAVKK